VNFAYIGLVFKLPANKVRYNIFIKLAPYGTGGRLLLTAKCQLKSHVTPKLGKNKKI